MGNRIAILIGNTAYDNYQKLKFCKNDVKQMHGLISATGKFSQIVDVVDKPLREVKNKIRTLLSTDTQVDEVLFYFSGHGVSNTEDFYMCFKGSVPLALNSTALSREETYDFIRRFNAKSSVVIFDACESGRSLIKGGSAPLERNLKSGFKNFTQFSSCTESQESLGSEEISDYTNEFIKACLLQEEGEIYYSDIQYLLRDVFKDNPNQTQYVINQSELLDVFCDDASLLDKFRKTFLKPLEDKKKTTTAATASPIQSAALVIRKIDEQVPTEEDAQKFIERVIEASFSDYSADPEISNFYETRRVSYDDYENVDNYPAILNLLKRRGGSDCFVECEVTKTKKRHLAVNSLIEKLYEPEYFNAIEIKNNCRLTSVHAGIYFESEIMALKRLHSEIVFLPQLTECLILTCNSQEPRSSWGSYTDGPDTKQWKWSNHAWTHDPATVASEKIADPYSLAKSYLLSVN